MTSEEDIKKLTADRLKEKIESDRINNTDKREGVALVNVLSEDQFRKEHLPSSINIPKGQEARFEQKFDKAKHIVVYCASTECDASDKVAERLTSMGFKNVGDFEAGVKGWRDSGYRLEGLTSQ